MRCYLKWAPARGTVGYGQSEDWVPGAAAIPGRQGLLANVTGRVPFGVKQALLSDKGRHNREGKFRE